uniref:3-keto-alpha-glucoside-1,2-lyase/3-keto-2-hydroxy-glucal hydratase domain-containing protein n=1 Tax=Sphingobacterium sp. (strain 21) TaxID=743722 RepID=F4C4D9_SPHS2
MNKLLQLGMCALIGGTLSACQHIQSKEAKMETPSWVDLFNGKNLDDWTVKIAKHEVGENYANTFRVENGVIKVGYEGYDQFDQQYGHIFYNKPYSYYLLRVEYRFVGEQAKGGEGWAWRNSGIMLHGQEPHTMLKDQDFPISLEAQLLGGNGKEERSTGNLCTPGTEVVYKNEQYTPHCLNSNSKTYAGDQWVTADVLALGDSIIKHIINRDTVMVYTKPTINGGGVSNYDPKVKQDGKLLSSGYFSLQSESHPIEFRKVAIIDLEPYAKDPKKLDGILKEIRERDIK